MTTAPTLYSAKETYTRWPRTLIMVLALALGLRLFVVLVLFDTYIPTNDAAQLQRAAENLLAGRGLIVSDNLRAYRPPLYPLVLAGLYAVFGVSIRVAQFLNVVLGVCSVWLGYNLARRVFGSDAGTWAGILLAVYPLLLYYTGQLLTETLFVFLLALGLWSLLRLQRSAPWASLILPGIIFGLAALTRPTALPIAFLVAVWLGVTRRSDRIQPILRVAAFFLGVGLAIAPWTIRNHVVFRRFVPLTSLGGWSLYIANHPGVQGTLDDNLNRTVAEFDVLPELERGAMYQARAIEWIKANPATFLRVSVRRLIYFWHLDYHGQGTAEMIFLLLWYPLLALMLFGVSRAWRSNREALMLLLCVPIGFSLLQLIFLPDGRYRLPIEFVVLLLASQGLVWVSKKGLESCRC